MTSSKKHQLVVSPCVVVEKNDVKTAAAVSKKYKKSTNFQ